MAAVGFGGWSFYTARANEDEGARWQRTSVALSAQLGESRRLLRDRTASLNARIRQVNAAAATIRRAREQLKASEADVESLEQRQRELANEKAQVEDQRASLEQLARSLEAQRDTLIEVAEQLSACSDGMGSVALAFAEDDRAWLYDNLEGVVAVCDEAERAVDNYNAVYGS